MQSVKDILAELGFNLDAPIETQKAFVKHLIRAANEIAPQKQNQPKPALDEGPAQLEFDFSSQQRVS